ncbi:SAM-dependent methyltransferase [Nocardia panacis]|uniref:SAM-dependent methyltransferase n=1 Tax=Nocardia panacis TaxID=2340916 RepID=A0A3A4JXJ4_9NOCA|nr:SAM-dependent methyltransferase [Nocardia panacis]
MERVPEGVDPTKPNTARVYNYLLGGKDNYAVDQAVAHRMLLAAPDSRTMAWFSRKFLAQAVTTAAVAGVRQFIDLGAGIPTTPSVHEVAKEVDPAARVVSVDYDPVVFAHANAMLAGVPGVTPMLADVRRPEELLERLEHEELIDFTQPVAILCVGVLHFVMDHEHPAEIVAHFREAMAPGSYLAFTHGCDNTHRDFVDMANSDTAGSPAQFILRPRDEVASYFKGFEMLEPGLVTVQQWLGDDLPATRLVILGGVCRKP